MGKFFDYVKYRWGVRWAKTPEEKYPALSEFQKSYREKFEIVDQCLIYIEGKENHTSIVYIDDKFEVHSRCKGKKFTTAEEWKEYNQNIAKLRVVEALPVRNLPKNEILSYKKILATGFVSALHQNWEEVDMAINEAKKYRAARNREQSRFLLLSAAMWCISFLTALVIPYVSYCYYCDSLCELHNIISGIYMGALGAFVSIWTRYGKMDMTGLGRPVLHYLEAISRILIGMIFAMIIIITLKSGVIFDKIINGQCEICLYCLLGFCAGFSEKMVPTVLERFIEKEDQGNTTEKK